MLLIGLLAGGGVLFVHTRDDRYAKIEFYPDAFFMESAPDILRDLSLRYVYDPDGSRDLHFQERADGVSPVASSLNARSP